MYDTQSDQEDTAVYIRYQGWGSKVGRAYYRAGNTVWQVRVPEDNGHVKAGRVAGESQEGRKNLGARRLEGAQEAAEKKKTMA